MVAPILRNRFTDTNPSFPYQSSEATRHLGIPDSPAIHLAITQLAELLLALSTTQDEVSEVVRITALRCASYGALMKHSFETVVFRFGIYMDLPPDEAARDRAEKATPIDWLSQAVSQLESEGIAVPSGIRQQATPYGWRAEQ